MSGVSTLFDLLPPVSGQPNKSSVLIFHTTVAILVFVFVIFLAGLLGSTTRTPTPPTGWNGIDYDANQLNRKSLTEYLVETSVPDTVPMNQFSVATANFGGIYTENIGMFTSWNGSVSADAARLQVEAGARAVVVDIWPNPTDPDIPVVCTMLDTTQWTVANLWVNNWGLNKGVGRYSNWQKLTRNVRPAAEILTALTRAAFNGSASQQNTDPFFLILKLHGAMTPEYLERLGAAVRDAVGGNGMASEWNRCQNQKSLCTAPVSAFMSRVFVIVLPDIQPGYNSLPGINSYAAFTPVFLSSLLGEYTNAMEQVPHTLSFEPSGAATVAAATQPNCSGAGPTQSLAQTGLCVIQPSVGGATTLNTDLFANTNYVDCLKSGAQFVAVNVLSGDSGDGVLTTFFDNRYFGKYSFRTAATAAAT